MHTSSSLFLCLSHFYSILLLILLVLSFFSLYLASPATSSFIMLVFSRFSLISSCYRCFGELFCLLMFSCLFTLGQRPGNVPLSPIWRPPSFLPCWRGAKGQHVSGTAFLTVALSRTEAPSRATTPRPSAMCSLLPLEDPRPRLADSVWAWRLSLTGHGKGGGVCPSPYGVTWLLTGFVGLARCRMSVAASSL